MKIHLCFFLLFSILFTSTGFSQKDSYQIIKEDNVSNIADYSSAMDNANFDSYRYVNKRRKIFFDSGVEIELLSVYELQSLKLPVNASNARIYNDKSHTNPIFKLGNNGHVLVEIKNQETKTNLQNEDY